MVRTFSNEPGGRDPAAPRPYAGTAITPAAARFNLRDFGGYGVVGGGTVRRGALYRSAQLCRAGVTERGLLNRLGIAVVIDFRGTDESGASPGVAFDGYAGRVARFDATDSLVPQAIGALADCANARQVTEHFREVYRRLAYSSRFIGSLAAYFDILSSSGEPTLAHCFAGKDRTGLAAALAQTALGVHRDDVLDEYLLTNRAGEERIASGLEQLSLPPHLHIREDILVQSMMVEPVYLDAAFETIAWRDGSVDRYFSDVLHVDRRGIERMRANFVA